jgi:transposase-like protein
LNGGNRKSTSDHVKMFRSAFSYYFIDIPILLPYYRELNQYIENIFVDIKEMQFHCPQCGRLLWKHGKYERNAVTGQLTVILIWIFRLYCPECKKTFSLIPSFLKPRYSILMSVFEEIIFSKVILHKTYVEITQTFSERILGGISLKTLYRYIKKIRKACKEIVVPLESFLCSYLPEKQIHTLTVMNDDPDDYIKRIYTLSTYYGLVFEKYLKIQYLTPYSYFSDLNARVTKAFVL